MIVQRQALVQQPDLERNRVYISVIFKCIRFQLKSTDARGGLARKSVLHDLMNHL
jgi:hypothetical protein